MCVSQVEGPQSSVSEKCVESKKIHVEVGKKIRVSVSQCQSVSVSVSVCVEWSHVREKAKKFQRRESNPRLKRERLECYRLHHIGLIIRVTEESS